MEIFNRPHSIAEDTLHYALYPPQNLSDKISVTSFAACITDFVTSKLDNFVWHRDAFELKVVPNLDNGNTWILEGRMRVGDSVDDEWLTVWLLKAISSKWDVVISAYDSDGEFLLIEAAEALPSWVKPTNSENRVWIYNSHLHLIPLSHISPSNRKRNRRKLPGAPESDDEDNIVGDNETFLAAVDAVNLVRDPSIDTLAPPLVQQIVWNRISGYPDAIANHIHHTKAYVPIDIAKALAVNPALVQKAVETFYTRDAIQLRSAHRMNRFPPNTSVLSSVKMTRTAYAQLLGQKFFPPKVFGNWKEPEGSAEWKRRDVGMKIAVGFEMLYQESKGRVNVQNISPEGTNASVEANKDALRRTPEYQKYIESLESAGYFQGQIRGSELWNALEDKAATTYVAVRQADNASRQSFASQVDEAIGQLQTEPKFLDAPEDSDDWLNVDAEGFEQMLEASRAKPQSNETTDPNVMDVDESPEDRIASEQAKRLKDLASKVENFIEGEGDVEGARFEDEEFSDEEFSDKGNESDIESDVELKSSEEVTQEEKQAAMDKLVPALEPTDYGKMPASYSKSQRVAPDIVGADTDASMENLTAPSVSKTPGDTKTRPTMRPPIIPRDEYEGVVDSDDETDEENEEGDESEEDRPQVVGEIEIDMDEEEEEFLEFSRQALGISDEQWSNIVKDRKDRGAFLPTSASRPSPIKKPSSKTEDKPAPRTHIPRVPEPGPRPNVNPDLDSFEAVMKALDEALTNKTFKENKASKAEPPKSSANKGKEKETLKASVTDEAEDDDFDIEAAMAAELKGTLEDDWEGDQPPDYNMIKNFLESYKSQQGLSGPVGNLAGRLQPEFKLPRDDF